MKIKLTNVFVDDQEKALRFYTDVLGFVKKADFSNGPFRWLTVASPEDPEGTELQLALNDNPAAKAFQQAMFQQGQPAAMFFTDNVQADYDRMKARDATFTMPPTDVTGSKIARLNDTCGNLIQVTQLVKWKGGRSELEQLDSTDAPLGLHCLHGVGHRHLHRVGSREACRLGELCAALPTRVAPAHRSVFVRAAVCQQVAQLATH